MRDTTTRLLRLLAVVFALMMIATSCGGDSDTETVEADEEPTETTEAQTEVTIGGDEETTTTEPEVVEDAAPASGTLRYVEFSPVTTFNPAGTQSAQSAYVYPVYDTLTRQNNDFTLSPSLATSWSQPDPNTWVFELRDDVTFHDGAAFNAQVAVDNFNYHSSFEGNPNAAVWATYSGAEATDDYTVQVNFAAPAPQFALQMSMVMGMMISPNALDGSDLTRNPQGSGAWIWNADESEAGATEVYDLNPDYWDPAAQGVERVTVTAVPDNNARMNALLTDEADIMATTRDAQIDTGLDGGMTLISVPNYFPYLLIVDRAGTKDAPLADENVRKAILHAMDLDAYNDAIHAGKGDGASGYYPPAFSQFHDPALAASTYDPELAKQLLADAGYADGVTIEMPVMPAIQPHMDIVIQMLGAVGIEVDVAQINNGELGPRLRGGESTATWFRDLLTHPGADLAKFTAPSGPLDPFGVEDTADLHARLQEGLGESDPEAARAIFSEVVAGLIDRGILIPLGHGGQNGMYNPNVTGVTMGLNMQAPLPHGVRVGG